MGCACLIKGKFTVTVQKREQPQKTLHNKNYFRMTIESNWLRIIDFLNYKDLKESAKINRSQKILIKFYRNKLIEENHKKIRFKKNILNNFDYEIPKIQIIKDISTTEANSSPSNNFLANKNNFDNINIINLEYPSLQSFDENFTNDEKKFTKNRHNENLLKISKNEDNEIKPKIYYEDFIHVNFEDLIKIISIKETASDNLTPSFKLTETDKDYISSFGDHFYKKSENKNALNLSNLGNDIRNRKFSLLQNSSIASREEKENFTIDNIALSRIANLKTIDEKYQDENQINNFFKESENKFDFKKDSISSIIII